MNKFRVALYDILRSRDGYNWGRAGNLGEVLAWREDVLVFQNRAQIDASCTPFEEPDVRFTSTYIQHPEKPKECEGMRKSSLSRRCR